MGDRNYIIKTLSAICSLLIYAAVCHATTRATQRFPILQNTNFQPWSGTPSIEVSASQETQEINSNLKIHRDPTQTLHWDQILDSLNSNSTIWKENAQPGMQTTDDHVWIALTLHNNEKNSLERVLLWRSLLFDKFEIHFRTIGAAGSSPWEHLDRGRLAEWNSRERWGVTEGWKFTIPPEGTIQAAILVHSKFETRADFFLATTNWISERGSNQLGFYFFFLGLGFALVIYNLSLAIALQDKVSLTYIFYLATFMIFIQIGAGLPEFAVRRTLPFLVNFETTLEMLATFSSVLFARTFVTPPSILNLESNGAKKHWPSLVFSGLIILGAIALGLHLLNFAFGTFGVTLLGKFRNLTLALSFPTIIAVSIYRYRMGYKPTAYFLMSWIPLFGSIFIWQASVHGLIPDSFFTSHAVIFGAQIEMLSFSIAISARFHSMRQSILDRLENRNLQLQDGLVASAKLSNLGLMAGGIAHEINNPLAIIEGRTFQIRKKLSAPEVPDEIRDTALKGVEAIDKTVGRIADIVRGLRAFAAQSEEDPLVLTKASDVIQESLLFCKTRFEQAGISLRVDLTNADKAAFKCRKSQISQILLHLFNNSFDALTDSQSPTDQNKKWVHIRVDKKSDVGGAPEVDIVVSDSGSGIPADIAEKIMNPFFTTKPVGKGTGLGLSISNGIARAHGGDLILDRQAKNTTFRLILPGVQEVKTSVNAA